MVISMKIDESVLFEDGEPVIDEITFSSNDKLDELSDFYKTDNEGDNQDFDITPGIENFGDDEKSFLLFDFHWESPECSEYCQK